ncbi:MAG: hypothetical protein AB7F86_07740 [Bdellovibrionales bacterium]
MKKFSLARALIFVLMAQPAVAQKLLPATSEDIDAFDVQVSKQMKKSAPSTGKSQNSSADFGGAVVEEAKKLKESTPDSSKNFGQWVSGQRRRADQGQASVQGAAGAGNSGNGNGAANSQAGQAPGNSGGKGKKKK